MPLYICLLSSIRFRRKGKKEVFFFLYLFLLSSSRIFTTRRRRRTIPIFYFLFHLFNRLFLQISLSISIMLSLVVFFLLLSEILPPTSLGIPLLGRYLLFTLILVTLSVCLTIIVLNINFRSPSTHRMAPWVKKVFLIFLPRILKIKRPNKKEKENYSLNGNNT